MKQSYKICNNGITHLYRQQQKNLNWLHILAVPSISCWRCVPGKCSLSETTYSETRFTSESNGIKEVTFLEEFPVIIFAQIYQQNVKKHIKQDRNIINLRKIKCNADNTVFKYCNTNNTQNGEGCCVLRLVGVAGMVELFRWRVKIAWLSI